MLGVRDEGAVRGTSVVRLTCDEFRERESDSGCKAPRRGELGAVWGGSRSEADSPFGDDEMELEDDKRRETGRCGRWRVEGPLGGEVLPDV